MEITIARHWRLLWELVKRDLRARYVGSIAGLFWSVINPLVMLVIYIFVFSFIFGFGRETAPADGAPAAARAAIPDFPVYLCCGLLPWNALMEALLGATAIIAASGGLIKKAVFPTSILPMQAIVASFVNLTITMLLLGAFLLGRDVRGFPGLSFLMIVPLMMLQFILIAGPCYFFATINVFFRDVGLLLSAVMMFLFWLTPIVYKATMATGPYPALTGAYPWMRYVYFANPVAHLVRLYRDCLYTARTPDTLEVFCPPYVSVLFVILFGLAFYAAGKYVFTRSQPHFVDEV